MSKRPVAFAIKNQKQLGSAPTIVAKGHGAIAENILRLAFDNDVRVRTDEDLTEILSVVDLDCGIPLEAFAAVAEILSYVYNANSKIKHCKKSDGDDA